MTALSLHERMRHAVAVHGAASRAAPSRSTFEPDPALASILRGEWRETACGPVFLRDEWYPLDHEHGRLPLGAALDAPPAALRALLAADAAPSPHRLAFFDIETTGLAGGTGTYVMLAGLGSYEDGGFRSRQYFLADVAHERAMLAALADDFARFDAVVTYNGRAFDVPVVTTRMTLARLRWRAETMPHFDLLHPVRRLYRHRMPACRLADIERRLLRLERFDDIPGWLIPSLYFDYLRAGRVAPLRAVFRHNEEDVLSLAGVLASLCRILSDDSIDPEDAAAAALWWERAGDGVRAQRLYHDALPWLEGGDDWAWAARRYATLCRRAGDRDEAAEWWRRLWERGDRHAGLELAKHLEHHARRFDDALDVVRALLCNADSIEREALAWRMARLERKSAAKGGLIQRSSRQSWRTA